MSEKTTIRYREERRGIWPFRWRVIRVESQEPGCEPHWFDWGTMRPSTFRTFRMAYSKYYHFTEASE